MGAVRKAIGVLSIVVLLVFIVVAGFKGIFFLDQKERAPIFRFGSYIRTAETPGVNFKIPFIDKAYKVDVSEVRRLELGFQTDRDGKPIEGVDPLRMITATSEGAASFGLIDLDGTLQYTITDPYAWLINVDDPDGTLRIMTETAIMRTVAQHTQDDILTVGKDIIQNEIREKVQALATEAGLGVTIKAKQLQDVEPPEEVQQAFNDVTSALETKNRKINQGNGYYNKEVAEARGKAAELINKAQAQKETRVRNARGDVAQFLALLTEYTKQKTVTRTRLYLEAMAAVLPKVDLYIVDDGGNTIKWLPLTSEVTQPQAAK